MLVIGGGAAGFFCAVNAARMHPQLRVILAEKSDKLLSKVKVSGGGRCNVTHACFDPDEMSRRYPRGGRFVRKAFHHFFTTDTIEWFRERGVKLKTEPDGRMFPVTDSSQTIINCLLNEATKYGVEILTKTAVTNIIINGNSFEVRTSSGVIKTDYVCVASGGYGKEEMFNWLAQTGHTTEQPVPSLFTFNMPGNPVRELMGISVENVVARIAGTKLSQEGPLLITHWGMSGPAILKLSAWGARELAAMQYNFTVVINWLPALNEQQVAEQFRSFRVSSAAQKVMNRNPFGLPQRLWEYLLKQADIAEN
ncbi:MAG: aminoacetone oxidase family FAD-binding enzyme, partial [Chitinophagaceae bacterium]|nr:aminoacetone oxidase family FAD-binding enzyme [Chitinophagaceae bacterium]